jgi:hypothetical protein
LNKYIFLSPLIAVLCTQSLSIMNIFCLVASYSQR